MFDMRYIYSIVFLLLIGSCQNNDPDKAELVAFSGQEIQRVEVVHPEHRSFEAEVRISGTAYPNRQVELHALESGFVSAMYGDIGDFVSAGKVIAKLNNPELRHQLSQAKAMIKKTKSNLQKAVAAAREAEVRHETMSAIYQRLENIHARTPALTTLEEVEKARANQASAQAALSTTRADIEVAEAEIEAATALKNAYQDRVNMLSIRAPFSGVITERHVHKGAAIQSSLHNGDAMPVVSIQDLDPIRLTLPVPEAYAGAVKPAIERKSFLS